MRGPGETRVCIITVVNEKNKNQLQIVREKKNIICNNVFVLLKCYEVCFGEAEIDEIKLIYYEKLSKL